MFKKTGINPVRQKNYNEWYQQIIKGADLAETSMVRGAMVIKPWGYGIWELIQCYLDKLIKLSGHDNVYFPLLIPIQLFSNETTHIDGFSKECAVVTHSRLVYNNGQFEPSGLLDYPYVIRPTSETIISGSFSKWVKSYRDLPILINQWANVMRWEMRTRMFLRTSEFLWQEGHTVHSTSAEAVSESLKILDIYEQFCRDYLAIAVIKGKKPESEKFPGANTTYCIEALMQDGKALQMGTSHFLGQTFSKGSKIEFANKFGCNEFAWGTSWGVSTRLIGGAIMTHSDDDGLVLPPKIAPKQVVIIPIFKNSIEDAVVLSFCRKLVDELVKIPLRVHLDECKNTNFSEKKWNYIRKGVPVRVQVGFRDVQNNQVEISCRNETSAHLYSISVQKFVKEIKAILEKIQNNLLLISQKRLESNTYTINSIVEFDDFFNSRAGFAVCSYSELAANHHLLIKHKTSPRCIPLLNTEAGRCLFTNDSNSQRVIFAKAY